MRDWTFLTNHTRVLACIAQQPGIRLREIAACVDITERAAWRIVCDLETDGYLTRHRLGSRNYYELHPHRPLRHPCNKAPPSTTYYNYYTPKTAPKRPPPPPDTNPPRKDARSQAPKSPLRTAPSP